MTSDEFAASMFSSGTGIRDCAGSSDKLVAPEVLASHAKHGPQKGYSFVACSWLARNRAFSAGSLGLPHVQTLHLDLRSDAQR